MKYPVVCPDPSLICQMLATWHSFTEGVYVPALVGWLGSDRVGCKVIYLVGQDGICSTFSMWQEARDVAASALTTVGVCFWQVEEELVTVPLHAKRSTPQAPRHTRNAARLVSSQKEEVA